MISDTERREVAARLRGEALAWSESYPGTQLDMEEVEAIFYELARFAGISGVTYPELIYARFADLIDRPTTTRHGKFRTKYGRETPCCEVCGYSIGDMRWNYCPKCGAVITDD